MFDHRMECVRELKMTIIYKEIEYDSSIKCGPRL